MSAKEDCTQVVDGADVTYDKLTLGKTSCSIPFCGMWYLSLHRRVVWIIIHPVNTVFNLWLTSVFTEVIVLVSLWDFLSFLLSFVPAGPHSAAGLHLPVWGGQSVFWDQTWRPQPAQGVSTTHVHTHKHTSHQLIEKPPGIQTMTPIIVLLTDVISRTANFYPPPAGNEHSHPLMDMISCCCTTFLLDFTSINTLNGSFLNA